FGVNWLVGPAFGESVNEGVVTDRWGAKALIEMYARPTNLTMASGSVAYSTIANNLQAQAKVGIRIFGDVYFGPEAKFTWQRILPFRIIFLRLQSLRPRYRRRNVLPRRASVHISRH